MRLRQYVPPPNVQVPPHSGTISEETGYGAPPRPHGYRPSPSMSELLHQSKSPRNQPVAASFFNIGHGNNQPAQPTPHIYYIPRSMGDQIQDFTAPERPYTLPRGDGTDIRVCLTDKRDRGGRYKYFVKGEVLLDAVGKPHVEAGRIIDATQASIYKIEGTLLAWYSLHIHSETLIIRLCAGFNR
jgi:hypothetical protein